MASSDPPAIEDSSPPDESPRPRERRARLDRGQSTTTSEGAAGVRPAAATAVDLSQPHVGDKRERSGKVAIGDRSAATTGADRPAGHR